MVASILTIFQYSFEHYLKFQFFRIFVDSTVHLHTFTVQLIGEFSPPCQIFAKKRIFRTKEIIYFEHLTVS